MRYLLIAAAVLAMNTLSASASNVSITGNETNIGKRFYSQSLYSLHRLDVGDMRTFNETEKLGNLQLVEGSTPHIILNLSLIHI